MPELDDLARRAVGDVTRLAARAARFAAFVFVGAVLVSTMSFLLGLAALEGGMRTVWLVFGLFFGGLVVVNSVRALWRLASVGRHAGALVAEVRTLLESDGAATRTVIDTMEAGEQPAGASVLVVSRDFSSLRDAVGGRTNEFRHLLSAVTAMTTFPLLILSVIGITFVFAALVPLFLLALAL